MTDLDLDAIESRAKRARATGMVFVRREVASDDPQQRAMADSSNFQSHALTDVPALVARVRELEAEVDQLRDGVTDAADNAAWQLNEADKRGDIAQQHYWTGVGEICANILDANKCGAGHENCPGYHYDAGVKVYHSYADYCDV